MFSYINKDVTLDDLLSKVTVFDILSNYFGVTKLPACINNPCRKDDNPSLGLYYNKEYNTILFKDFATGETGNIFTLLCKLWNCSFSSTLNKINDDIETFDNYNIETRRVHHRRIKKSETKLEVKMRDWKDYDLEFWNKYGISKDWLVFGNIFPISHIILTKDNNTQYIKAEKYAYVYIENKDDKITLKVYQPYSKRLKWLSKHDSSVIDLWTKLPESGEHLIITSSRKDALCTWACTGIPCISMQGEGYWPKPQVIKQLKDRFKNIFVLFDNDFNANENHGHIFAEKLSKFYNLNMIELPSGLQEKDQSDVVKHYGKDKLREIIYNLINNTLKS